MGAPEVFALFVLAALVLPLRALSDLAKRDFPDRDTRAIWVLAVLLLVIIGPVVYFVIGRSLGVREDSLVRRGKQPRLEARGAERDGRSTQASRDRPD